MVLLQKNRDLTFVFIDVQGSNKQDAIVLLSGFWSGNEPRLMKHSVRFSFELLVPRTGWLVNVHLNEVYLRSLQVETNGDYQAERTSIKWCINKQEGAL